MAKENNGCLIFIGVIAAIGAVGLALAGIAYAGMSMVIGIDYLAGSFTWLGVGTPMIGWLVLGLVVGAFVGLTLGLKRAQRSPGLPVYAGAGVMSLLILAGAYYAKPPQITDSSQVSATQNVTTSNSPGMYIDKIGGKITSLRFFEGGSNTPPEGKRVYTNRFAKSKTRYVNWQLDYSFQPKRNRVDFTIDVFWYRPDGSPMDKQQTSTYIEGGWRNASQASGWGWRQAGNWQPGTYQVDLYVEGKKVASGQFTIN